MTKQIQIACVPSAWDNSTITALGTTRNRRAALPKTTLAKDLPEPWLTIWHTILQHLQTLDPNGWAATFILVDKACRHPETPEGEDPAEPVPYLHLSIHRRWDDNTTADPVELDIENQNALALFHHLTADE